MAVSDPVWIALITAVPATIGAIGGMAAWKNSKATNDAVNHRDRQKGELRLVELVESIDYRLSNLEDSFVVHLQYHTKENQP